MQNYPNQEQEAIPATQECSSCHRQLPLDAANFSPAKRYKYGFRRKCRECESKAASAWNKNNRERATGNRRRWVAENHEHNKTYQRNRYHEMREAVKIVENQEKQNT